MVTVFDVPPDLLIKEVAKDLKENLKIEQPVFADFVKTGQHKERSPQEKNWWYARCASIFRRVYKEGPIGTESLRTYYGGRKSRKTKPHRFKKSSGKIVRTCLQALEKQGFIEKDSKGKKGRKITGKGESYLNAKANIVFATMEQEYKRIEEERKIREEERRKRVKLEPEKKEEVKKKKKAKEEEDPTKVKMKKKQKGK